MEGTVNKVEKQIFIQRLFEKGAEAGFQEMEVYISGKENLAIEIFKGDVNKYAISEEQGLSFRGLYQGQMGYAYTERLYEDAISMLIASARDNALILETEEQEYMHDTGDVYEELITYNPSGESISNDEKIKLAKQMEASAYAYDKRVENVNYCVVDVTTEIRDIKNSKGLDLHEKANLYIGYISLVVRDGEDVQTGRHFITTNDYHKLDVDLIAKKAVNLAIGRLGAASIASGSYPVILKAEASAKLLKAYIGIFSADNVHKKLSLLQDKLGEKIAGELITMVDNPFMEDGAYSSSFDAEGVATSYKKVVDKGQLTTYLHNLKTSTKDGVKSTGNAKRGSYKEPIDIAPSNFYIEKGTTSYDDMLVDMGAGVVIDDVQGLHSGVNKISGDFSLSASGYEVVNGKISRPINQITIAGSFLDLLGNVLQVGNDLTFDLPVGASIGSPSLRIKKLSVSGM